MLRFTGKQFVKAIDRAVVALDAEERIALRKPGLKILLLNHRQY